MRTFGNVPSQTKVVQTRDEPDFFPNATTQKPNNKKQHNPSSAPSLLFITSSHFYQSFHATRAFPSTVLRYTQC